MMSSPYEDVEAPLPDEHSQEEEEEVVVEMGPGLKFLLDGFKAKNEPSVATASTVGSLDGSEGGGDIPDESNANVPPIVEILQKRAAEAKRRQREQRCWKLGHTIVIILVFLTLFVSLLAFQILFSLYYFLTGALLWKVVQELRKMPLIIRGAAMVLDAAGIVAFFWCYRSFVTIVSAFFYLAAYLCLTSCTNFGKIMKDRTKQLEREVELGVFAEKVAQAVTRVQTIDGPAFDTPPTAGFYQVEWVASSDASLIAPPGKEPWLLVFGSQQHEMNGGWLLVGKTPVQVLGLVGSSYKTYWVAYSLTTNHQIILFEGQFDPINSRFSGNWVSSDGISSGGCSMTHAPSNTE